MALEGISCDNCDYLSLNIFSLRHTEDNEFQRSFTVDPDSARYQFTACSVLAQFLGDIDEATIQELINRGAPINPTWPGSIFRNVINPLYYAVQENLPMKVVRVLLTNGADPTFVYTGATALSEALVQRPFEEVKEIFSIQNLQRYAKVANLTPESVLNRSWQRYSPFVYVAGGSRPEKETIQILNFLWNDLRDELLKITTYDLRCDPVWTMRTSPLHTVSTVQVAKWFLKRGFSIDAKTDTGTDVIMRAIPGVAAGDLPEEMLSLFFDAFFASGRKLPAADGSGVQGQRVNYFLYGILHTEHPEGLNHVDFLIANSFVALWEAASILEGFLEANLLSKHAAALQARLEQMVLGQDLVIDSAEYFISCARNFRKKGGPAHKPLPVPVARLCQALETAAAGLNKQYHKPYGRGARQ